MQRFSVSIVTCLALGSSGLAAQGIGEISVDRQGAVAQQPVKITIKSKGDTLACGLEVNFGDGTTRTVRGDQFPVVVEHTYQREGMYAVAVAGKVMFRGLRTLGACDGIGTVALTVGPAAVGTNMASPPTGTSQGQAAALSGATNPAPATNPPTLTAAMGMTLEPVSPATAGALGFPLSNYTGQLVRSVESASPAAAAGIAPGDVLTHVNDEPVLQQVVLQARDALSQGRSVKATIFRAGQWYAVNLAAQRPSAPPPAPPPQASRSSAAAGPVSAGTTQPSRQPATSVAGAPAGAVNPGSCRQGAFMEPREFTQPEVLGRPRGERAQMCFYRMAGSRTEFLNFFSTGHFYHTSISGSGGFASSGAVYGTVRGTYGFQPGGALATRVGYQGTGVSQSNRGAGSQRQLDVSAQGRQEIEVTLQNCQKITYTDELKRVQYDRTGSHPNYLVVDGVRWERYSMECPPWRGWTAD